MIKIKDVSLQQIREGTNWKVNPSTDFNAPIEEWELEKSDKFDSTDRVAYSAIFVTDDGAVSPLILIKEVGYLDYGGDYAEYKNGKWTQLGLVPNPNAPSGKEFIPNPLSNDPSFDASDDYRKEHRENFNKWVKSL